MADPPEEYNGVVYPWKPNAQVKKGGDFKPSRVRVGDVMFGGLVLGAGQARAQLLTLLRKLCIYDNVKGVQRQMLSAVNERALELNPTFRRV